MEFITTTMYLLGVWLYGFMLQDVEPGSSRANTMGKPFFDKRNKKTTTSVLVY